MPPSLTIVVPIHNEADFLPNALPRLFEEVESLEAEVKVLLVENGSTDGTGDAARRLLGSRSDADVLSLTEPDYGAAMRAGFLHASTEWVVNVDIDYFSGEFFRTALGLSDQADIVLASKRVTGADDRRGLLRRLGTLGFNLVLRLMFGSAVSDTHGMKMVRASVVDDVVPRVISNQDLFDTELVIRAERAGYRIRELPARVEELREARSSLLSRVPRTLLGMWRIRRALKRERSSD